MYFSTLVKYELSLGLTLMILTVIAGQEVSHLTHWTAGLLTIGFSCAATILAGMTCRL